MGKLFFFHFQVTNLKVKNKKFYFESLMPKVKEQNLDFEFTWDFFVELKYYMIENYLKKCRHVGFCDFRHRSCSQ